MRRLNYSNSWVNLGINFHPREVECDHHQRVEVPSPRIEHDVLYDWLGYFTFEKVCT